MKSKSKINILRCLFVISLIVSLYLITSTYAKYVEQVDAKYESSIKRWRIKVNDEIIREVDSLTDIVELEYEDIDYINKGVLVPGREAYFDMEIDFDEVDVPFSLGFDLKQNEELENYNVLPDFKYYGCYIEEYDIFYYNIPDEYQQVEYIESTGTQYINTGIVTDTEDIETIVSFSIPSFEGQMWLGGSRNVEELVEVNPETEEVTRTLINSYQTLPYISNGKLHFFAGSATGEDINGDGIGDGVYREDIDKNEFYKVNQKYDETAAGDRTLDIKINGFTSKVLTMEGTLKNDREFWLFANNDSEGDYGFSTVKIRELKYIVKDLPVLDLVPCYRKSDGEIGMYDMATGKFFTNDGTGTFIKGEDVPKVVIDPESPEYQYVKKANVRAFIKWVDADGNEESPINVLNNTEDTNYALEPTNTDIKYTATVKFEQYIED